MKDGKSGRRLIVNADDFGCDSGINGAVIDAHRHGVLTTASLMVNEPGFEEAVALARENPSLGVGLHLTFLFGHSALSPKVIPGLVNSRGEFGTNPPAMGFRLFKDRSLRPQVRAEIHAQFEKFRATGLPLDHVNGHLHLHLHPTVFHILMEDASRLGIKSMRLTFDPFWLNLELARGNFWYRVSHAIIFHLLAARARPALRRAGIAHTQAVFGLLQNGRVDEDYVMALLARLPSGDSELYSHPSPDKFKHERDALISAGVRREIGERGIRLIRYQDL